MFPPTTLSDEIESDTSYDDDFEDTSSSEATSRYVATRVCPCFVQCFRDCEETLVLERKAAAPSEGILKLRRSPCGHDNAGGVVASSTSCHSCCIHEHVFYTNPGPYDCSVRVASG